MRGLPLFVLLALAGCNPGIAPPQDAANQAATARNEVRPAPEPVNAVVPAAPINVSEAPAASEPLPGVADMSPYRRREYERGYRDCRTGNFDGERQGESYRIGCMAAQEAR